VSYLVVFLGGVFVGLDLAFIYAWLSLRTMNRRQPW
jgi:hypothetical protein